MSTSSIQGTAVRDLAATIYKQLDADQNGQLSSSEFEGFLSQFLTTLQQTNTAAASAATANATAPLTSLGSASTTSTARPAVGTMAGFDAAKLASTSHDTFKYQIGRILQGFPNTPAGLRDALPEIQQLVPGAKIVGSKGDKIDFGNFADAKGTRIGVVDVLQAAGLGGTAWQWCPEA